MRPTSWEVRNRILRLPEAPTSRSGVQRPAINSENVVKAKSDRAHVNYRRVYELLSEVNDKLISMVISFNSCFSRFNGLVTVSILPWCSSFDLTRLLFRRRCFAALQHSIYHEKIKKRLRRNPIFVRKLANDSSAQGISRWKIQLGQEINTSPSARPVRRGLRTGQ